MQRNLSIFIQSENASQIHNNKKFLQKEKRLKWINAICAASLHAIAQELYVSECTTVCDLHKSICNLQHYTHKWMSILGSGHIQLFQFFHNCLSGLYKAHKYFQLWLRDELAPKLGTFSNLEIFNEVDLQFKLQCAMQKCSYANVESRSWQSQVKCTSKQIIIEKLLNIRAKEDRIEPVYT